MFGDRERHLQGHQESDTFLDGSFGPPYLTVLCLHFNLSTSGEQILLYTLFLVLVRVEISSNQHDSSQAKANPTKPGLGTYSFLDFKYLE